MDTPTQQDGGRRKSMDRHGSREMKMKWKIFLVIVFGVAFAFVESSVVTYLRALYYPEGFSFPLRLLGNQHVVVELVREFSTIVMLVTIGLLAGTTRWQKFSYFMVAFGVWDIFYYVWLKVILNWPVTLFDWDILFLIPLPWIGPVIAPIAISILMGIAGIMVIRFEDRGGTFHPPLSTWLLSFAATVIILFTFIRDTGATLHARLPKPYSYVLFSFAVLLYIVGLVLAFRKREPNTPGE
jgi:hypothetical protein